MDVWMQTILEKSVNKQLMHNEREQNHKKIILLIGLQRSLSQQLQQGHNLIVTFTGSIGGTGSGTFLEGQGDGKNEGYRDAINGRPFDDRCPSGKNNEYCIAYRLAYDWEYWVTRGLPRK